MTIENNYNYFYLRMYKHEVNLNTAGIGYLKV